MKTLHLYFILFFITTSQLAAGQTQADWLAPAWRSALAPGWGQAYNEQETKAWVLGGLTWGLLGGVVFSYAQGTQAVEAYGAATTPGEATDRFNEADRWALTNQILYACFAASYVYNIVDAGLNAQTPRPRRVHLGLAVSDKGPRLGAIFNF